MKRTTIERKLRQKLAGQGVVLQPGSRAERGVKLIASVGAEVTTTGARVARDTRNAVTRMAETAREAIHEATKPPGRKK